MLQQIKITDISIYDKHILADALNLYGEHCQQQYVLDSDNRGYLVQYSIAQSVYHNLTQLFNSAKVLKMTQLEKQDTGRSQKLLTHSAVVAIAALQYYQDQNSDTYIKSRSDVLWNKMESELI